MIVLTLIFFLLAMCCIFNTGFVYSLTFSPNSQSYTFKHTYLLLNKTTILTNKTKRRYNVLPKYWVLFYLFSIRYVIKLMYYYYERFNYLIISVLLNFVFFVKYICKCNFKYFLMLFICVTFLIICCCVFFCYFVIFHNPHLIPKKRNSFFVVLKLIKLLKNI